MKAYGKTSEGCLRVSLYSAFDNNIQKPGQLHNCCSNCHKLCVCGGDRCAVSPAPFETEDSQEEHTAFREVSDDQKVLLKELLLDYKLALEKGCSGDCFVAEEYLTGFSDKIIDSVVDNCQFINSLNFVLENIPVLRRLDAVEIVYMINDIFEDIDSETLKRCKELVDSNKQYELVHPALYSQDKDKELVYSSESDIENYEVYEDDLSGIENLEELSDGTDIDM